jgi:hypothetical protein
VSDALDFAAREFFEAASERAHCLAIAADAMRKRREPGRPWMAQLAFLRLAKTMREDALRYGAAALEAGRRWSLLADAERGRDSFARATAGVEAALDERRADVLG